MLSAIKRPIPTPIGLAKLLIAYSLGGLAIFSTAYASTPQAEIDHLLSFVATTECQYERNGTLHDATAAVNHIKKKYDYFIDDIATAEDFIEYAATKSSFSGKFYKIHCHGVPAVKSNAWLTDELKRFRDANQ